MDGPHSGSRVKLNLVNINKHSKIISLLIAKFALSV